MAHADLEQARAAKERAKVLFAGKASVVGVGINRVGGGFGVKVNLSEPAPPDADLLERSRYVDDGGHLGVGSCCVPGWWRYIAPKGRR